MVDPPTSSAVAGEALKVVISQHGQATLLTLSGPLTAKHVAALRRAAFEAESHSRGHCVLDMTDVDEIDGYGLSTLVGMLARRGAARDSEPAEPSEPAGAPTGRGKVVLFGVSPDLRPRFEATFCDTLFPIRSTLAHALELVGE
jgi:anti-anti-sigma regulatory factor